MISHVNLDCGISIHLDGNRLIIENHLTRTSVVIDDRTLPKNHTGAKVVSEIADVLLLMVKKQ